MPFTPTFPLPTETTERLTLNPQPGPERKKGNLIGWYFAQAEVGDHPGLAFYKFVPLQPDHKPYKDDYGTKYLQALADRFKPDGNRPWNAMATAYADRQKAMAEGLKAQGFQTECLELHTTGRFLVGMGYKNALEVGLTFHHTGGFPYLPGTAVKGLCRAWAEQGVETETPPKTLQHVFGTATKSEHEETGQMITGAVRFFDALPLGFPKLEADLMNPHYGDYYSDEDGKTAPGDWLSPVPIPFLTVAAGQPFRFLLASRDSAALTDAKTWLKAALKDLGAGSKTAAGYGYFVTQDEPPPDPEGLLAGTIINLKLKRMRGTIQPEDSEASIPFLLDDAQGVGSGDKVVYRSQEREGQTWAVEVRKRKT